MGTAFMIFPPVAVLDVIILYLALIDTMEEHDDKTTD